VKHRLLRPTIRGNLRAMLPAASSPYVEYASSVLGPPGADLTPARRPRYGAVSHQPPVEKWGYACRPMTAMALARQLEADLTALRRHLHAHPELSHEEKETAALAADRLRALGLEPRTGIAGHGVVADLRIGDGPLVMLRADMDALGVDDEKDVAHRSTHAGVTHACGHDLHTATLIGVANLLVKDPGAGHAGYRFVFQPAEEATPGGANGIVAAGTLEGVWAALCVHADPSLAPGTVGLRGGPMTASADVYRLVVRGRGGHSSRPHQAADAIAAATAVLQAIYALRGRVVDPLRPSVVNAGFVSAGRAPNALASRAEIAGTIRCTDAQTRKTLHDEFRRSVEGAAASANATIEMSLALGAPPLRNDERLATLAHEGIAAAIGESAVHLLPDALMGAEDFAIYAEHVPAFLLRVGTALASGFVPLHSGRFDVDDRAIPTAVAAFAAMARRIAAAGPAVK